MPFRDADWPEDEIIVGIREAIRNCDRDLQSFVKGLLQSPRFLAAPAQGDILSLDEVGEVMTELTFLLNQDKFQRSIAHQKIFAGLVITTVLRRYQWRSTAGIKEHFLAGQRNPNVSEYVKKIQDHVNAYLSVHREGRVRILILEVGKKGYGYGVRFCAPSAPAIVQRLLCTHLATLKTRIYDRATYCGRIATALEAKTPVRIATGSGRNLLESEHHWHILETMRGNPREKATLLLAVGRAADGGDPEERKRLEESLCSLRHRISQIPNASSLITISFHSSALSVFEIAQIGADLLLVGRDGGHYYAEVSAAHPLFETFLSLLQMSFHAGVNERSEIA
jgi:hypothetical protein